MLWQCSVTSFIKTNWNLKIKAKQFCNLNVKTSWSCILTKINFIIPSGSSEIAIMSFWNVINNNMGNLIYQTQSNLVSHAYCGTYSLFCVFSDSRASSLEEAQSNCKKINDKSWPVELDDWNFGDTFKIFIQNYSISNIILNAQNKNGTWFWIQAKIGLWSILFFWLQCLTFSSFNNLV